MVSKYKIYSLFHASLIFFFSFFIIVLGFYPGTLNMDSQWQLMQANQNSYHDGHPPLMSYIWHLLNDIFKVTAGSANMFLLITILFSLALMLIACIEQQTKRQRWLFIVFSLSFLPMLLSIGFIIKDSLMAVSLLLTYAILLWAEQKKSLLLVFFSLIPLFVAFSSRHNSIFAIIPFCFWYGLLLFDLLKEKDYKNFFSMCTTLILLASLIFANHFFVYRVLQATHSNALQFLLAYDLVGISVRTKENYLPTYYQNENQPLTTDFLENMYRPYSNYYVFWGDQSGQSTLKMIASKEDNTLLIHQWIKASFSHPKEMFLHKSDIYFSALGLKYKYYQLKANELTSPIGIAWNKVVPHQMMDGWIYLLGLTIFLFFQNKLPRSKKILLYSGYLYGISWILVTPNAEQRYFFWVMMSFTVLLLGTLTSKIKLKQIY